MIGQKQLIDIITGQIQDGDFPRFSIIVGSEGSGKRTLCQDIIIPELNMFSCFEPDNKVETVRNAIMDAYKVMDATCYIFTDVDDMSVASKNALLKVTEEPPNNAYFIMTVCNLNTVLDTIKSRAVIYQMQPYIPEELVQYTKENYQPTAEELTIVTDVCENPGDVDQLYTYDPKEFMQYVAKTVEHIASVSSANAFKVSQKLRFKDDGDGYEVGMFLRAFKAVCGNELRRSVANNDIEGQMWFSAGLKVVNGTLDQLRVTGINKQAVFDIFILDIRREWM